MTSYLDYKHHKHFFTLFMLADDKRKHELCPL